MATRWNGRTQSPIYSTRPEPRWDAEQLVARIAFVVVPWIPIIGTALVLGWRPL